MLAVNLREYALSGEREALRWFGEYHPITVTDDHGNTLETNTCDLTLSWYGMGIHRHYPKQPFHVKEIVQTDIYRDEDLKAPIEFFLDIIMPDIDSGLENDFIKQQLFVWEAKLNNYLKAFGERGAICATAEHVLEVIDHPKMVQLKEDVLNGHISIDEGENVFRDYMLHDHLFENNTFELMSKTGDVSTNQGYQKVITRGHVFDVNNQILPNPIEPGYADGIVNLADSLGEKNGASKAQISNGDALEKSEWFHRELHLVTNVVKDIDYHHDCGTTKTIPMLVTSQAILNSLQGKYHVDGDGKLILLTQKELKKHKVGEVLALRSIAYCNHLKSGTPCKTCYGKMKAAIPYNAIMLKAANPGMFSSSAIAALIGQGLLSTKHFLRNSVTVAFEVAANDADLIHSDGDNIFLNKDMVRQGTHLVLRSDIVSELSDLKSLESLEDLNEDQLRTFDMVSMVYQIEDPMVGGTTQTQCTVKTSVSTRLARMSKEFIEYVIKTGWEVKDKKSLWIDLSGWEPTSPMFFLPYVFEDLDVYRASFKSELSFSKRNKVWMAKEVDEESFADTLTGLWDLLNKKFKGINIVHTETILSCLLCRDPDNGLYRLPRGDEPRYFRSFSSCIANRGMGSLLIHQGQDEIFENPNSYSTKERQSTVLEAYWRMAVA